MTTVKNIAQDASGTPLARARVTIRLLKPPGYVADDEATLLDERTIIADDDGAWEIDLVPNDEIAPDNTRYEIVEQAVRGSTSHRHVIVVPDEASAQWVGAILADPPASLPTLHSQLNAAHGATSSATPDRIVLRDGDARARFADPDHAQDAATRGWVEGELDDLKVDGGVVE